MSLFLGASIHCIIPISDVLLCSSLVLISQGKVNDAYNACSFALTKLGESIPDSMRPDTAKTMIKETLNLYEDDEWLKKRKMEDNTLRTIVKFYMKIATAAYFCKPKLLLVYFVCRSAQLNLRNGIFQHTPLATIHFASIAIKDENAAFV